MHQEITSPSFSSRKIFHMLKTFRRTNGVHCFCSYLEFNVSVQGQCRFRQSAASISPVLSLARCSLLLLLIHRAARLSGRLRASVAMCRVNSGTSRRSRTARGGQQGPTLQDGAVQHRPHHQEPPRGHPLLCACCRTVAVA